MEKLKEEGKTVTTAETKHVEEPEKKASDAEESREKKDARKRSISSSSSESERKQKHKKKKHRGDKDKRRSRGSESDEVPAEDLFGEKRGKESKSDMFAEDMFADEFSSPTAENQQAQRMSLQVTFYSNYLLILNLAS